MDEIETPHETQRRHRPHDGPMCIEIDPDELNGANEVWGEFGGEVELRRFNDADSPTKHSYALELCIGDSECMYSASGDEMIEFAYWIINNVKDMRAED